MRCLFVLFYWIIYMMGQSLHINFSWSCSFLFLLTHYISSKKALAQVLVLRSVSGRLLIVASSYWFFLLSAFMACWKSGIRGSAKFSDTHICLLIEFLFVLIFLKSIELCRRWRVKLVFPLCFNKLLLWLVFGYFICTILFWFISNLS